MAGSWDDCRCWCSDVEAFVRVRDTAPWGTYRSVFCAAHEGRVADLVARFHFPKVNCGAINYDHFREGGGTCG